MDAENAHEFERYVAAVAHPGYDVIATARGYRARYPRYASGASVVEGAR
jgi:hypothetical protein